MRAYCVLRIAYCVLRIAYCVLRIHHKARLHIPLFLSLSKDYVLRIHHKARLHIPLFLSLSKDCITVENTALWLGGRTSC